MWGTRERFTIADGGGSSVSSRSSPLMGVSTYTFCVLTVRGLVRVMVWSTGAAEGGEGSSGRRPATPPCRLENKREDEDAASPPTSSLTAAAGGGGDDTSSVASGLGGGVGGRRRTAVPGREGSGGRPVAADRRPRSGGLRAAGKGGRLTLTRLSDLRPP